MTLKTLTTVTLLKELMLAQRTNNAKGVGSLLEMSLDELALEAERGG